MRRPEAEVVLKLYPELGDKSLLMSTRLYVCADCAKRVTPSVFTAGSMWDSVLAECQRRGVKLMPAPHRTRITLAPLMMPVVPATARVGEPPS